MICDNKFVIHEKLILLLILIITAICRIPTLLEPWGGDQGVFGYIANGILEGKVPYKDMYTSTGYGIYFTYVLFFKLFGNHMAALHIGDMIATLITVILVFYLTRHLFGKETAIIATLLAAFFGNGHAFSLLIEGKGAWGTYWQLAQRETFMSPLFTGSILITLIADQKKKWYLYFWTGLLMGLAAFFKITAVGLMAILIGYILFVDFILKDGGGLKSLVFKVLAIIIGFIVIQLPFLYYFWIHDTLYTMYKAVFVFTSVYAKLSRGLKIVNAFEGNTYIISENLILWLFMFVSMIYLMVNNRKKETYLLVAWTIGTLMIIWAQGKFFGYHYILIIPPFSVLSGFGMKHFLKIMPTWKESFIAARKNIVLLFLWTILIINVITFLGSQYEYFRWNFNYLLGKISKSEYYEVFNEHPIHMYSFRANYKIVNYLNMNARPGASLRTIYGGGDHTMIHYLSNLNSSTKFTSTWYIFNKMLFNYPIVARLRKELIEGVIKEKPDYILMVNYSIEEFREYFREKEFNDITRLMDYIEEEYVFEKDFGDRHILYKRNL